MHAVTVIQTRVLLLRGEDYSLQTQSDPEHIEVGELGREIPVGNHFHQQRILIRKFPHQQEGTCEKYGINIYI